MKSKDVKVGEVYLADNESNGITRRSHRVTVVEIGTHGLVTVEVEHRVYRDRNGKDSRHERYGSFPVGWEWSVYRPYSFDGKKQPEQRQRKEISARTLECEYARYESRCRLDGLWSSRRKGRERIADLRRWEEAKASVDDVRAIPAVAEVIKSTERLARQLKSVLHAAESFSDESAIARILEEENNSYRWHSFDRLFKDLTRELGNLTRNYDIDWFVEVAGEAKAADRRLDEFRSLRKEPAA